jgi:hypothetical protein
MAAPIDDQPAQAELSPPLGVDVTSLLVLHSTHDDRLGSASIMTTMTVAEYLALTEPAYKRRGAVEGQREALATSTAIRIRNRMADDLRRGAVLPPVVVGVLVDTNVVKGAGALTAEALRAALKSMEPDAISIIDGMQRTTVLRENREALVGRSLRTEIWLSDKTSSLTYRMLILNTGQVPWNLRRQIEVINASLITEIVKSLRDGGDLRTEVYRIDDKRRRFNPGEYQANDVVEMYLAFGLRKPQVDKESVLVDQFSRLDMIEAVSNETFLPSFTTVFRQLIALDRALGRVGDTKLKRFALGRSLFDSQPACVGFMAAAAQKVFGRPGADKDNEEREKSLTQITERSSALIKKMNEMPADALAGFVDFQLLEEVLSKQTSKVGEFERGLFTEAFRLLFEEGPGLKSLAPCWRVQ